MAERHRAALEAVLAGIALRPRLLADLLEAWRGGREIAIEALDALSREVERAVAVPGEKPGFHKLVVDGVEIGRIVEENIKKPYADTKLAIKMRDLYVELELNERRLLKAVRSEELRKLGEGLGRKAFVAAARRFGEGAGVMEGVFASALALEKYLAELGEKAERVVEGMWGEIGRLWEDGIVHSTAFKFLQKYFGAELKELLAEIEKKAEGVKEEAGGIKDPYSRLPRELKRALVEAFLGRAPEVLRALRREGLWALQEFDRSASEAKKLPQYKEYVEALEGIADLLKAAAKELAKRAEDGKRYGLVEIKGKLYPAYEGPVELSARVEHVEKDGKTYAVIEVKYGEKTARVELEVEELKRSGLLHNLAAIATDDARNFYTGCVSHKSASYLQAAERLLMWALFMPGDYKITVEHVHATEEGLSPMIEIESRFGWGGIEKIEGKSPIHRLVLRLARELAGGKKLNVDKVLAASWLLASAILNMPDGGRPSEGLAVLVVKGVLPRAIFDRLRPIFEELDALLGPVSREDKAYLVGKMVDYDGYVKGGLLWVRAEAIKKIPIELDGVEINMADVAETAAKAFWKEGGWSGDMLYFGPAREVPLKAPAYKAIAALITKEMQEETRKEADELRRKDLVEYGEPIKFKGREAEIKVRPAKAKEGERTPITQLEEIWKGFEDRKYTHLRLVIGGEEYESLNRVEGKNVRFRIGGEGAQKLAEALKGLGLKDVKPASDGYLYLYRKHLEALLSKGVKAYAVRKAKMGEAMWHVEITYGGVTMELKMTYDEHKRRLMKLSRTGKIEVTYKDVGAAESKLMELNLKKLADIKEGRDDCKDCLEKRLAEALDDIALKNPGFNWSITGKDMRHLYVYLPGDFEDAVRRLK